jgi:hypothetical protein
MSWPIPTLLKDYIGSRSLLHVQINGTEKDMLNLVYHLEVTFQSTVKLSLPNLKYRQIK